MERISIKDKPMLIINTNLFFNFNFNQNIPKDVASLFSLGSLKSYLLYPAALILAN